MSRLRFSTSTLAGKEFVPWLASDGELAYSPIRRRREITTFSILGSFLEYFTPVRAYDGISGSAVHLRTVRR